MKDDRKIDTDAMERVGGWRERDVAMYGGGKDNKGCLSIVPKVIECIKYTLYIVNCSISVLPSMLMLQGSPLTWGHFNL